MRLLMRLILVSAPRDANGFIPSRWQGQRPIDWAITNDCSLELCTELRDEKLGDHKILQMHWSITFDRQPSHSFVPTDRCCKPPDISAQAWKDAIACYFEQLEVQWCDEVETDWLWLAGQVTPWLRWSLPRVDSTNAGGRQAGRRQSEGPYIQKLSRFLGRLIRTPFFLNGGGGPPLPPINIRKVFLIIRGYSYLYCQIWVQY